MKPFRRTLVVSFMGIGSIAMPLLAQTATDDARIKAEAARTNAQAALASAQSALSNFQSSPMKGPIADAHYQQGAMYLDRREYERAVVSFDSVITAKAARADGAYYWKAYALNKLGKRDEALAALGEISRQFPQSRWLGDAKALEAEVRQANGQPVSPESQADEDLKLYAINALINSDPERTVPLLEKLLSEPKNGPKLKERALYVLAQSNSPKARDIVGQYAKGGTNPDLQLKAVEYLGSFRASKENQKILADTYASVNDVAVKRAILRSYQMQRDTEHLVVAAKSEPNVDLRKEAIRLLAGLNAPAEIAQIYSGESDKSIKTEILRTLGGQRNSAKQLVELVRKESDPELKKEGVRVLSNMKSQEATDYLMELLSK